MTYAIVYVLFSWGLHCTDGVDRDYEDTRCNTPLENVYEISFDTCDEEESYTHQMKQSTLNKAKKIVDCEALRRKRYLKQHKTEVNK